MSAKKRPDSLDEHEFNHALYHHLGHWAAYVAMMVLLATFGFVIALSPAPDAGISMLDLCIRGASAAGVIIVVARLAIFFAEGMDRYGGLLHLRMGKDYLDYTLHWEHEKMIRMEKIAAIAGAFCDIGLLVIIGLLHVCKL